jgi:hypothetical protein
MWPATAWDDAEGEGTGARGWTVMGRLYERQLVLRRAADETRERDGSERHLHTSLMMASSTAAAYPTADSN